MTEHEIELTPDAAGQAMHTLLTRLQFCRNLTGIGWCCPCCMGGERAHTPGCELVAVLNGWKSRRREAGDD